MSPTQQVEHTDSIASQDPAREDSKKTKSKRPPSKRHSGTAAQRGYVAQRRATLTGIRYGIPAAALEGMAVRIMHRGTAPDDG